MGYLSQFQRTALLGASAALVWAVARRYLPKAEPRLIDWDWALKVAIQTSGATPLWHPAARERLAAEYRAMVDRIEGPVADYVGNQLSLASTEVRVMDRHDWVRANLGNFRQLFEPLEHA